MKMKKYLIMTMALALTIGLMQSISFADKGYRDGQRVYQRESIQTKFFKTVRLIYLYQDELKVSDEQLAKIKELKVALKKDLIRKKADIKIIKIDIRSLLQEHEVDIEAVNRLIDQKYEIKKAKSKMVVESYAKLKKVLSKEQMDNLKEILRGQKKMRMTRGSWKGGR
jgi:Spy/CpxP family protein refolding chaperone